MTEILMIEDEGAYGLPLKRFFEAEGYEYDTAETKQEAINKYKEKRPDIVMIDLDFDGRHGFDMFEELKRIDKNVRVVVISAFGEKEDLDRADELGAKGFLVKAKPGEDTLYYIKDTVDRALKA
ncbi:MAG: response regulator [Elusimicrobiota bacterium]